MYLLPVSIATHPCSLLTEHPRSVTPKRYHSAVSVLLCIREKAKNPYTSEATSQGTIMNVLPTRLQGV